MSPAFHHLVFWTAHVPNIQETITVKFDTMENVTFDVNSTGRSLPSNQTFSGHGTSSLPMLAVYVARMVATYTNAPVAAGITVSNFFLLFLYARKKKVRNNVRIFVANLAVFDFQRGCIILPLLEFLPHETLEENTTGRVCAFLRGYTNSVFFVAHLGHLLIGLDRFLAISLPFRHENIMSKRNCWIFIIISWIIGLLVSFGPSLGVPVIPGVLDKVTCHGYTVSGTGYTLLIVTYSLLIVFIEVFLYGGMYYIANKHTKEIAKLEIGVREQAKKRAKKNNKAAITTLVTTGLFIFCWVPYTLAFAFMSLCLSTGTRTCVLPPAESVALFACLGVVSNIQPLLNPIIFAFRDAGNRQCMKEMLCFCMPGKNRVAAAETSEMQNRVTSVAATT